jgi:uncharacterized membrane protein YbaN (DUF454 family)
METGRPSLKERILVAVGLLSTGMGIVGMFVPLWPTTVFLLIAAGCFLRGSPRLHRWLTTNKRFGVLILSYTRYRGIAGRTRIVSLVMLWAAILSSAIFVAEVLWLRLLLIAIGIGVTVHLVMLRTLTTEMVAEIQEDIAAKRARPTQD